MKDVAQETSEVDVSLQGSSGRELAYRSFIFAVERVVFFFFFARASVTEALFWKGQDMVLHISCQERVCGLVPNLV